MKFNERPHCSLTESSDSSQLSASPRLVMQSPQARTLNSSCSAGGEDDLILPVGQFAACGSVPDATGCTVTPRPLSRHAGGSASGQRWWRALGRQDGQGRRHQLPGGWHGSCFTEQSYVSRGHLRDYFPPKSRLYPGEGFAVEHPAHHAGWPVGCDSQSCPEPVRVVVGCVGCVGCDGLCGLWWVAVGFGGLCGGLWWVVWVVVGHLGCGGLCGLWWVVVGRVGCGS